MGSTTVQATACSTVAFLDDKVRFTGSESIATAEKIHFWDIMVITGTGNLLLYLFLPLLFFCCSSVSSFIIRGFYWLLQSAFSLHSFNIFHTFLRLEKKLKIMAIYCFLIFLHWPGQLSIPTQ